VVERAVAPGAKGEPTMTGRMRIGATMAAFFVVAPLATAVGADLLITNLVLSSNPAFNPTPGNDNGVTFEVLEVPVGGTATVNVTLVAEGGCDASAGTPLVIDVLRGLSSNPLVASVSEILGRPILAATAGPPDTRSTVSPTRLTFTACGVPQQLTVTGGPVVNRATNILFNNVASPPAPCQDTCELAARFVVVTRDPDQSLPGVVQSSTNWALGTSLATMQPNITFTFGTRPLVPLTGDWNGDGTETPGYYSNGTFFLSNTVPPGSIDLQFVFGNPRGFPVAGDFNGDGFDDVAVFLAGVWEIKPTGGAALTPFVFGPALNWPTVVPVAGDWNGDGTDGIGIYNLSGGGNLGEWNLRQTPTSGAPEITFVFGGSGLYPVVGDWDGDGTDGVGTKVMAGTTWTLRNTATAPPPVADRTINFGVANALPMTWKQAPPPTGTVIFG
jgi:hypothetical protein